MRHWATLVPKQQAAEPAVYKRVRDMDYVRPDFVVHVKDGGQLFLPDPAAADSPNYEVRERIRVEPGHGTLEDQRERDRYEVEFLQSQKSSTDCKRFRMIGSTSYDHFITAEIEIRN